MNWFKKLFKKKDQLRYKCVEAYGEKFGELYDEVYRGNAIGDFLKTAAFLDMIEAVKQVKPYVSKVYSKEEIKIDFL